MTETAAPYVATSDTSLVAAQSLAVSERARGKAAVLSVIQSSGPIGLTDEQIAALSGLSPNCARPRRIELWRAGAIIDMGLRATASGRMAAVWVVK